MGDDTNRRGTLAGKTALKTGSTRGIGRTIAEWLGRDGANIIVSGRQQEVVEASVTTLREHGITSFEATADLTRPDEAHRLADEVLMRVEQLAILVDNAG